LARADPLRLTDGERVLARGHPALRRAVDALRLEEAHRILAADCADQEALRIHGIRGADDLKTAGVDEEGLGRLRVVMTALDPASDRRADDERGGVLAAGAVAELPKLVHDLIEGGEDEVAERDTGHRLGPEHAH